MHVLVTGARGSIGELLVPQLEGEKNVWPTDIEDLNVEQKFSAPMYGLVFHLAGAKHAAFGEDFPAECFQTNVVGTQNVLAGCPDAKVILASTCKAANPETVYGATKLIAERMVLNAGGVVARFFNVRETQGNVFRLWETIPEDQPIPYTNCWRYFISVKQAAELMVACSKLPSGRYIYHPGEPSSMRREAQRLYPDRELKLVPLRRGDRMREPLHGTSEQLLEVEGYPHLRRVVGRHD